ncbi:STAS domain-containing protein [Candidatus Poribacteria bacterium]|nr:STAS domain-containing protein [Candidatus Poribacteria bacterium]
MQNKKTLTETSDQVTIRERNGVTILDIEKVETTPFDNLVLKTIVDEQIDMAEEGKFQILFNLQKVPIIYSSVIGIIIYAHTSALRKGGRIALLHASGKIKKLFKELKLQRIFDWYDDEEEAIASFQ